jgi:glycolate oxidase
MSLPEHGALITDPDIRAAYAADTSGLSHVPDAVARPGSEAEVVDLLRFCNERRIAVTPQGLRSSTTGASVPITGIALSLERMNRVIEIDPERRVAIVEPGAVTFDFKQAVRAQGLFYPPDPTSEEESTLGGNVACNASGSRTYRYGATRRYVRALRVVLADGTIVVPGRIATAKNAAGYFGFQNPVDLWVGSEGTLGVVTRIEVDLLPAPPGFFGALAFFPDWRAAIGFVLAADEARRTRRLAPRCLELFDRAVLRLVGAQAQGFHIPDDVGAAIFFEEEIGSERAVASETKLESARRVTSARGLASPGDVTRAREGEPGSLPLALDRWLPVIESHGGRAEQTIVATTEAEQIALRKLRHAIPSTMNDRGAQAVQRGGRRVGTDFAVPLERLPQMLEETYAIIDRDFGGFAIVYGHVGSGHPHINLLAEDAAMLSRAEATARTLTRRSLELGGTLSGEHGIGKVKASLFREFYPAWLVDSMRAVKAVLDPRGVLGPGNLFGSGSGSDR